MPAELRSRVRVVELALAATAPLVVAVELTSLPQPYPTWPEAFGLPVNPSLVVPGLLAVAVLAGAALDGITVHSLWLVALSLPTLFLGLLSIRTLMIGGGGVFWGGYFTLILGIVLSLATLLRATLRGRVDALPTPGSEPKSER